MKTIAFTVADKTNTRIAYISLEILECSGLESIAKLQDCLTNAVCEWVKTTAEGKQFFEASHNSISLASLVELQPFSHLFRAILAKHCINFLKIVLHENILPNPFWGLDDALVDTHSI